MASNKYLDFTGLSHFLDKIKSIFAPKKQGVEYINGTQTAATGNWTGETADNELYEGKMIAYRLPFGGSGNATLNLTFANGTTSGPKNVYLSTITRMTTHVWAGNTIILVYHEANVIGSTTYQGWWMDAYYNTNDQATRVYYAGSRAGRTVTDCPPACIFLTQSETMLLPTWAGTANSTAATHVMTTEEFDPFGRIYYKAGTAYNAASVINVTLCLSDGLDLRYAFNVHGFNLLDDGVGTTIYMVCKPTKNGKAVLHSDPITKTLPIEEDGLLYVFLGRSYASSSIQLALDHPVYMFDAEAGEAIAIDRSYLLYRDKIQAIHEVVNPIIPTGVPELGSIITFDDGADGAGLKKCTIEFHATQDLHGYDHPWPAGGGKNKIPMTIDGIKSANTAGTWNGNAYSFHNVTFELLTNVADAIVGIRVSGTCSGGAVYFNLTPGSIDWTADMIITGCPIGGSATKFGLGLKNERHWEYGAGRTIDADVSAVVSIWINNGYPSSDLIFYPMIRPTAETDATFAPYSNICPITGWTGMNVARTGKNLANLFVDGYVPSVSTGALVQAVGARTDFIKVKSGATYTFRAEKTDGTPEIVYIFSYDENKTFIVRSYSSSGTTTYTLPDNVKYVMLRTETNTAKNAQFEEGSIATAYEPYQGTTYPVSWQSEAGTLYNFTYDAITGKIVATHAGVDMGTLTWTAPSSRNNCFYARLSQGYKFGELTSAEMLCSFLKFDRNGAAAHGYYGENGTIRYWIRGDDSAPSEIYVHDDRFTDTASFAAAVTGQTLVYELAEPIEIQLTPPGITTLKGLNNIFTDRGEITEFEYYRDTQALDAVDSKYVSATTNQQFTPNQQLQARENIGATGIEYIRGTQTSQTSVWTGVSKDTALYDGKIICYWLSAPGTGSSATLNLTMADGTTTGAIPVYWLSTTRVTTHQAQYANWLYVYIEDYVGPSGTHYGAGWWSLNRAYYTDSYPSYSCREYTSPRTKTYLYRYMLCFSDVDKKLVPANGVNNSIATTKTLTTESFDPFGAIYYYSSTATVADNGAPSENTLLYTNNSLDLRYSFNTGSTLTSRQPVYVVCEPQSDGRVKLAENPIVQTIPLEDNGFIYIYLGEARSTSAICLSAYHDIYKVYNGAIYNIKALML